MTTFKRIMKRQAEVASLFILYFALGSAYGQKADNTAELRALMQREDQRVEKVEGEGTEQETISFKGAEVIAFNEVNLPEDNTTRFAVKEIRVSGNTLITTGELLRNMPEVYNASNIPLAQAPASVLYDFRVLRDIVSNPGQEHQVSERTMQGLTRYLLSVYQANNLAGIYVYIAAQTVKDGVELPD